MQQKLLEDIPTALFNLILEEHLARGWETLFVYDGVDAWIDYGRVDLRKGAAVLCFEWNNWWEGSITGPAELLNRIREQHNLPWSRTVNPQGSAPYDGPPAGAE